MTIRGVLRPVRNTVGVLWTAVRAVTALPELVDAVLVLPQLSCQLNEVQLATATLPNILAAIEQMRENTDALPTVSDELMRMSRSVAEVELNTRGVPPLAEIAIPLTSAAQRVGRLADRLPPRQRVERASAP